jgi:hypothetical protein
VNVLLIGRKARSCLAKLPAHFRLGSHLYRTRTRTLHVALRSSFSPPSIFFREMALARLDLTLFVGFLLLAISAVTSGQLVT